MCLIIDIHFIFAAIHADLQMQRTENNVYMV